MVCSSGVGFNPVVNGRRLRFELFGLYNAVMVMNDRETGSIWSHLGGNALHGPMYGSTMEFIPLLQTTWATWRELHPESLVLSDDTPYQAWYSNPSIGAPGLGPEFIKSIVNWDTCLPQNHLVLGVTAGGESKAYSLLDVAASGGVVNDQLAARPIVVFADAEIPFSIAFSREVSGEILDFENIGLDHSIIIDEQTGFTWNLEGRAVAGTLKGQSLSFVTSYLTEWYGWSAYHPHTGIYGTADDSSSIGEGDLEISGGSR